MSGCHLCPPEGQHSWAPKELGLIPGWTEKDCHTPGIEVGAGWEAGLETHTPCLGGDLESVPRAAGQAIGSVVRIPGISGNPVTISVPGIFDVNT